MNSQPHARPLRTRPTSLLVDVAELASRARAIVRRARRRTRRPRASERPLARLPGAAARLPRPLEVALREVGEPPTYTFGGGLRLYGLGPPPGRPALPPPEPIIDLLYQLAPDGVTVRAARRWEAEGLCFRLTRAETGARADGTVPPPGDAGAVWRALEDALSRLDAAARGVEA
ncbi:MAG TPA: hypothetical protein VFS43_27820 [Polyangiaceae bacterium]|nr:hypothetical protein [Polyangiaceae bacterium]